MSAPPRPSQLAAQFWAARSTSLVDGVAVAAALRLTDRWLRAMAYRGELLPASGRPGVRGQYRKSDVEDFIDRTVGVDVLAAIAAIAAIERAA